MLSSKKVFRSYVRKFLLVYKAKVMGAFKTVGVPDVEITTMVGELLLKRN